MKDTVSETSTALALPDEEVINEALSATDPKPMQKIISRIETEARSIALSTETAKARKEITSLAYKVVLSKGTIDKAGLALTENWRKKTAAVNAQRKAASSALDALADEIKSPLVEWEEKEAERKRALDGRLQTLRIHAPVEAASEQLEAERTRIAAIEIGDDWQEFRPDAERLKLESLERLDREIPMVRQREEEQAELARLRAEAAERERQEQERLAREDAERREREAEAERARVAAEESERRAKAAEERTILPLGVHRIDADAYHLDPHERPSLSSSLARLVLNQSPLHAWTACPRLNPKWEPKESKAFDLGRAAHRLVLGCGGRFDEVPERLLSADGGIRTKEAKEYVAEMRANGVTPLKAAEVDVIHKMHDSVRAHLDALKIELDPTHSEMVALAEIDGVPVRAMMDNAPPKGRHLFDLKSTTDASTEACIRAVIRWGYDVQGAHYEDVWFAATGERRSMIFIFVEKEPPYGVGAVELYADDDSDADWMLTARDKTREARRIWGECLEADVWPGYVPQIAVLGAPAYHNTKWADRQTGRKVVTPETIKLWRDMQAPDGWAA